MYTIVQSTKFVGFQLRFVVLLQLSHKPVCSCPQHSISKLAVVYGIFLLKQSCMWSCVWIPQISSCVTQPVGFLGVPKKSLNSSVPLGIFESQRTNEKPIIRCHYSQELQRVHSFQRLWDTLLLFIMDLWPSWCRCEYLPLPCVMDTSVVPHPCQFSASPAQLLTRRCQLFQPLLVKGSPLSRLWCS